MVVFDKTKYLSHVVGEDPLLNLKRIGVLADRSSFQDDASTAITKIENSLDLWLKHTDKTYTGNRSFHNADLLSLYYGVKAYLTHLDNTRSRERVKAWRDIHGFTKPFHVSRNLYEFILKPYVSQEIIGVNSDFSSIKTNDFTYVGIKISERKIVGIPKEDSSKLLEAI